MDTEALVRDLRNDLADHLRRLRTLRELPLGLLERRPAPGRWSVLEVCEHLNVLGGHYLRHLRKAYGDPQARFVRAGTHEPGRWGGLLTRAMRPREDGRIAWRMRTLWLFEPRQAPVKRLAALDDLLRLVEELQGVLDLAARRGFEGPRIISTLGPVIRFKAADAFAFTIAHQGRHLLQIDRTLEALGAPTTVTSARTA
jgi:hypothetical protein